MTNRFIDLFAKKAPAGSQAAAAGTPAVKPVGLKPAELLELVQQARPAAVKGIPEKQALAFVSAVITALGTRIDAAGETPVRIPGLGVFRPREVERKVDNEVKRVRATGFRRVPAAPRKTKA